MQITGAFLAQDAQIVDNKLNVTGGVLDWIEVPRAGHLNDKGEMAAAVYSLVTLMQAGPDDHQKPYRMTTEMVDPGGNKHVVADVTIAAGTHSGENRFLVSQVRITSEKNGRMVLIQTIDGGDSISIPVTLRIVD